jgi:hypothetical protein
MNGDGDTFGCQLLDFGCQHLLSDIFIGVQRFNFLLTHLSGKKRSL